MWSSMKQVDVNTCECGCGKTIKQTSRFARGHASKIRGRTSEGLRVCPTCKIAKSETAEFFRRCRSRSCGFSGICKTCQDSKTEDYDRLHPEKKKIRSAKYKRRLRKNDPQRYREIVKRCERKIKTEMVEAYGGKCSCCGETEFDFLTLEHLNRDGKAHRDEVGQGIAIWRDLKRRGWPKEGYTIYCWNCNMATSRGAICPHKRNLDETG